jgi:hypothetical protein
MEADGNLEVIAIAQAKGLFLNGADFRVQALGHGIGDQHTQLQPN